MAAVLLPNGKQYYALASGLPNVGGKVFTYAAGTNTPKATWADANKVAVNTNPVILDARGEAPIFWEGAYKIEVRDALNNLIYTADNILSANIDSTLRADLAATSGAALIGAVGWPNVQYALNGTEVDFLRKFEPINEGKPRVYDFFDRAPGGINGDTLPSGETWAINGENPGSVVYELGQGVHSTDDSNNYWEIPLSYEATRAALSFRFKSTGQPRTQLTVDQPQSLTVVLILETTTSARTQMAAHIQCNIDGGSCQSGNAFSVPAFNVAGDFIFPNVPFSLEPDTDYVLWAEWDRTTGNITIGYPGRKPKTAFAVPNILNNAVRKVTVQITKQAAGATYEAKPYVTGITIGKRLDFSSGVASGAASNDALRVFGEGVMMRQAMPTVRVTTAGFYRIARLNRVNTVAGYRFQGKFWLEAIASNNIWSNLRFNVNHRGSDDPLIPNYDVDFSTDEKVEFGSPITMLRAVTNGIDETYLEAYVAVPGGGFVDLRGQSTGYHALATFPRLITSITGYTAVPYTFPADPYEPVTFVMSQSGFAVIATGANYSSWSADGILGFEGITNIGGSPGYLATTADVAVKARYVGVGDVPHASVINCQQLGFESSLKDITKAPIAAVYAIVDKTVNAYDTVKIVIWCPDATANPVTVTVNFDNARVVPVAAPVRIASLPTGTAYLCYLRDNRTAQSFITATLTNGTTTVIHSGCPGVLNLNTTTIASAFFDLPAQVQDGDEFTIRTFGAITAVGLNPGSGTTVAAGTPATLAANSGFKIRVDGTVWRWAGVA